MSEKNLSVMKPRFWHLLTSLDCEEAVPRSQDTVFLAGDLNADLLALINNTETVALYYIC